jgi:hypothetical protein
MWRLRHLGSRVAEVGFVLRLAALYCAVWAFCLFLRLRRRYLTSRWLRLPGVGDILAPLRLRSEARRSVLASDEGRELEREIEMHARFCESIAELIELERVYWQDVDQIIEGRTEREQARQAEERALTLLMQNLTDKQRRQYVEHGHFDVIGGDSGRRYRIWHRTMQNIEELDARGYRRCIWCVHPVGVAMGDVLLSQKTALELFEWDAINIAHQYTSFAVDSQLRPFVPFGAPPQPRGLCVLEL